MVVEAPQGAQDKAFAALLREGDDAFRSALAAEIRGLDSNAHWDEWERVMAAILLASWASGALASAQTYGVPLPAVSDVKPTFARYIDTLRYEPPPETSISEVAMAFEGGPAEQVVKRFIRLMPLTRAKWESLIKKAFESAGELRKDEASNALKQMLRRSPELAALVRGKATAKVEIPSGLPESVVKRRTPAVQAAVQGSFFVTGMTLDQVETTKDILAKVILGEKTVSVAGKEVESMGIGDFVAHTVLETATNLTAARLETVYRTNVNRAQSQGRLDICRDDLVKKFVPLLRFKATNDSRTRDTHREMDGFVATVEQIDAMGIPTPLGFNCRCSWSPISIAKAVRDGLCNEDGVPDLEAIKRLNGRRQKLIDSGLVPDPGFISG